VHVDAYRLGGIEELDDLDLETSLEDSVTVVEWGEGLVDGLAADRLEVGITMSPAGPGSADGPAGTRWVTLTGIGDRWVSAAESARCALPLSAEAI